MRSGTIALDRIVSGVVDLPPVRVRSSQTPVDGGKNMHWSGVPEGYRTRVESAFGWRCRLRSFHYNAVVLPTMNLPQPRMAHVAIRLLAPTSL